MSDKENLLKKESEDEETPPEDEVEVKKEEKPEVLHSGRPKNEEPHVKKIKKRTYEKIEYILRVDLESLGINEDDFEDLQSLFELFDRDRDGILTIKELQMLLRCLGLKPDLEKAKNMAGQVSVDVTGYSVSFNEYLQLISIKRRAEPDEDTLMEVFRIFDPQNTGTIDEDQFRNIMKSKQGISDEDIEEMIEEYKKLEAVSEANDSTVSNGSVILYKEFISMLQN